jgi:hypothetical protein
VEAIMQPANSRCSAVVLLLTLVSLAGLLALARPSVCDAAWPTNPAAGVPVCRATGTQNTSVVVSDDAGGMIVLWEDERGADVDIYARRIDASGHPLWAADGVAIISFTGDQTSPVAIPDGSHGVIVAWVDARSAVDDIYAARFDQNGARVWGPTAICNASNDQGYPAIIPDGSGGAYVAWGDYRNSNWDIYAQRINASGARQWRSNGAPACSLAANQNYPHMVKDPYGGFFVTWQDYRPGTYSDVYAQRIYSNGSPAWTLNGIAVVEANYNQTPVSLTSDGGSGTYVAWLSSGTLYAQHLSQGGSKGWAADGVVVVTDPGGAIYVEAASNGPEGLFLAWSDYRNGTNYDIYAQYLNSSGEACWTANGRSVCTAVGHQSINGLLVDETGGLILVWDDSRKGGEQTEVYAQRLNLSGTAQWASNGALVANGLRYQYGARSLPDGSGGILVAYRDAAADFYGDISAQRLERFGHLGDPGPGITRVADVANDQGGRVQVEWTASYLDTFPTYEVEEYTIWRRVPGPAALTGAQAEMLARGGIVRAGDGSVLRTSVFGTRAVYWEQVAAQPARGLPGYSCVTATTSDSLAGSNPYTAFMVMAERPGGTPYWMSAADSGYSVDNLAPAPPAPFTGSYANGTAYLQWGQSTAADFTEFRLHRGHGAGFVPGASNLVATQATTGYVDAAGQPFYYKLCAVDIHGNASPCATLLPAGALDVPGTELPRELALSAPAPNPLRGSTTLRLALPRETVVTLAVFDQQGRRVRTLLAGPQAAGEYAVTWDGRDDGGRAVASGIYFVRGTAEGRAFTRRVVAMR